MDTRSKSSVIRFGYTLGLSFALALALPSALSSPAVAGGNVYAGKGKPHEESYEKCPMDPEACKAKMSESMAKRGWTGIEMDQDEETGALTIMKVMPGSPAIAGGLQAGDRIVALNGVKIVKDDEDMWKEWQKTTPGQKVTYTIEREGKTQDITVKLGAMPADVMANAIAMHMKEGHGMDMAKN